VKLMRLPGVVADRDRHHRVLLRMRVVADRDLVLVLGGTWALADATRPERRKGYEQTDRDDRGSDDTKAPRRMEPVGLLTSKSPLQVSPVL
jgi:hypothetical protein